MLDVGRNGLGRFRADDHVEGGWVGPRRDDAELAWTPEQRGVDRGGGRLESLTIQDRLAGMFADVAAAALFVLIGSEPHTDWCHGRSGATTGRS